MYIYISVGIMKSREHYLIGSILFALLITLPHLLPSKETALRFGIDGELTQRINPQLYPIISHKPVYQSLFATLFRLDQEGPPSPYLVRRVTLKGQVAEIELHERLFFSNGIPITSDDVITTLQNLLRNPQTLPTLQRYIEGADRFIAGVDPQCSGLLKIDPRRFSIRFRYLFTNLSQLLCETVTSILPSNWNESEPVFSGPYLLHNRTLHKGQEQLVLRKNPHWTLSQTTHSEIVFEFFHDPALYYNAIVDGQLDHFLITYGNELPLKDVPYQVSRLPINGQFYLFINPKARPFDQIEWRRFFNSLILNLSRSIQESWPQAIPARLVMPYGLPGYDLFKPIKSGATIRPPITELHVTLPFHLSKTPLRIKLLSMLNERLAPFNVSLEAIWEPVSTTLTRFKTGNFTLTAFYYMSETALSIDFYERLFTPSQELNPAGYTHAEALTLIERYHLEENELKRMRILARLEEIAQETAFCIPLFGLSYTLGSHQDRPRLIVNRYLNLYPEQYRAVSQ